MTTKAKLCVLIGLVAVLTACGGGGDDGGAGAEPGGVASEAAGGGTASMGIADFKFSEVTAPAGSEVTVTNEDGSAHTVTAEDESFDVQVAASASGTFTAPGESGDYPIVCKIHPDMKGTLTVE